MCFTHLLYNIHVSDLKSYLKPFKYQHIHIFTKKTLFSYCKRKRLMPLKISKGIRYL